MRIDGDALILLILMTGVLLVSLVLPFLGYVTLGLSSAAIAGVLDVCLLLDIRKGGRGRGGGTGDDPPERGGGGGSGVREPRRPKDKPPAAKASR